MVYDHAVIKDGILYETGKDVPTDVKPSKATEPVAEPKEAPTEQKEPARRGRPPKKGE